MSSERRGVPSLDALSNTCPQERRQLRVRDRPGCRCPGREEGQQGFVSSSTSFSSEKVKLSRKTEVAKDSDASLGTRATAAKDAMGSKMDETSHNVRTPQSPFPYLTLCGRNRTLTVLPLKPDQGGRPQGGCQALELSPRAPHNVASVIGNTTHLSCQLRGCGTRFVLEGGSRRNGLYSTSLEASY